VDAAGHQECAADGDHSAGQAFQNFFAGRARYPRFRKKGLHERFSLTNDQFDIDGSRIRIPNLGWVRMRETLRFAGKIMSATISRVADMRGMVRNRPLARSIADMGFFELRRQMEYKAQMRGGLIVVANRFFASSKTCSACGHKLDALPLAVREWTCPCCGTEHHCDVNAAINLKNMAAGSAVSACGEEGSGSGRKTRVKPVSMKQEVSFVHV